MICEIIEAKNVEIHLEVVYDSIIRLVNTQSQFYDDCFQELGHMALD